MPRSRNVVASKARKKKIFKLAKGFFGRRKNVWTIAKNAVEKATSMLISKPATYFKEMAYKSETLQILLPIIRHDALKTFGFGKKGKIGVEYEKRYDFNEVPNANYQIKNIPKRYAEYCRDSLNLPH